jgi:hypothetical protein
VMDCPTKKTSLSQASAMLLLLDNFAICSLLSPQQLLNTDSVSYYDAPFRSPAKEAP